MDHLWIALGDAGVPEGIRAVSTWSEKRLREHCDEHVVDVLCKFLNNIKFVIQKGAGIMIGGESGKGKTVIATWLFCQLFSMGLIGVWTREWWVHEAVINKYTNEDGELIRDVLVNTPLLLLDGVKSPGKNKRFSHITWDLLQDRDVNRNVNIITLQFNPSIMYKEYEEINVLKRLCIPLNVSGSVDFGEKRQRDMYGWVVDGN